KNIPQWLAVIGDMETLSSFAYHNPQYVFPEINQNFEIKFKQIVHHLKVWVPMRQFRFSV
ncbi:MAG: hypothetical protein ACRC0A_02970, partial [Chitinophagaceae bacterium]